jgi:electron transfer flavoprotein alpha subunit
MTPRSGARARIEDELRAPARHRVRVLERLRDDDPDALARAEAVVAVGGGVPPDCYPLLQPLLELLGAELAATRRVTDLGWLPRSRQVGITGHSISPRLYVALAIAGKFNHTVGTRGAGTVLAVNDNPQAPIFDAADIGIVAPWQEVVPLLTAAVRAHRPLERRAG